MTRFRTYIRHRHALDEDDGPSMSELRAAHGKLREACDSLGKLFGGDTFPFAEAREHCKAAADHAGTIHDLLSGGGEGEDELSEAERDRLAEEARDDAGEAPESRKGTGGEVLPPRALLSGNGRSADIGMSRAESTVSLRNVRDGGDHRKDFNSIKQGGADSAHGFDYNALLQVDEHNPRYRYPSTRPAKPKRKSASPRLALATRGDDAGFDLATLMQRDC